MTKKSLQQPFFYVINANENHYHLKQERGCCIMSQSHTSPKPAPTTSLDQKLLEKKTELQSSSKTWMGLQYAKNLINPYVQTGYMTAAILTDLLALNPVLLGVSWPGFAVGLLLGGYFSWSESDGHQSQNELYERTTQQHQKQAAQNNAAPEEPVEDEKFPDLESGIDNSQINLSCKQKAKVFGHYLSDVIGDYQTPFFIASRVSMSSAPWVKPLVYGLTGIYCALTNVQETKNLHTAYQDENLQEARKQRAAGKK